MSIFKNIYSFLRKMKARWSMSIRCCRMFSAEKYILRHYMGGYVKNNESHSKAHLTFLYHRIEKGLTMPNFRAGFGVPLLCETLEELARYETSGYNVNSTAYQHCLSVVREYVSVHDQLGYEFESPFASRLRSFIVRHPGPASCQATYTPERLWANFNKEFPIFAASRHTVRHYAGRVADEQIVAAIKLAHETAPQACNRNFVHIHYYQGDIVQKLLALQNGNSGFGHLCEQLIIVTVDMGTVLFEDEWFDMRTNAGIYVMNLSYSLHYHHVAHCILNCWRNEKNDEARYVISDIPKNELPVVYISCGSVPAEFHVAESPRCPLEDVFTAH